MKLPIEDRSGMLRKLARLRAKIVVGRMHEMNTLYDTSGGALARRGDLIRIRVERPTGQPGGRPTTRTVKSRCATEASADPPRALLTYKGPPEPHLGGGTSGGHSYKIREEQESQVEDPAEMAKVFRAMGLLPWFRYEKYRSTYRLPGITEVKVELDETPIGDFLELEGQPVAIDRAAKLLGFGPASYITKSYGALFMERRESYRKTNHGREPSPADGLRDMLFERQR